MGRAKDDFKSAAYSAAGAALIRRVRHFRFVRAIYITLDLAMMRRALSRIVATALALALIPAVGQSPSGESISRKRAKVATAPFAQRVLPDCDFERTSRSKVQRALLGSPPVEVVANHCDDYDAPTRAYVIDMRTSGGAPWLKLSVPSNLGEEVFNFAFADVTGDGLPDLVVSTMHVGSGPYVAVDLYEFDPQQVTFRRDDRFPGASWPALARTKGCVIFEERAGPGTYIASRVCRNAESGKWVHTKSCDTIKDSSCPKALMW